MGNNETCCTDDNKVRDFSTPITINLHKPQQPTKGQISLQPHIEFQPQPQRSSHPSNNLTEVITPQIQNPRDMPILPNELVSHYDHPTNKQGELALPQLTEPVKQTIMKNIDQKFFSDASFKNHHRRQYGNDFYDGELDSEGKYPQGFGRYYRSDGAFYAGNFHAGRAEGLGGFVLSNGDYYFGEFRENNADSNEGVLKSGDYQYKGGFRNGIFHGRGLEKDTNQSYQGQFYQGYKTQGIWEWKDKDHKYSYEGTFNLKNQFHGEGTLKQPRGVYRGDFMNGKKHGKGIYRFHNGLRYEGEYRDGLRNGKGTIFNPSDQKAYQGDMLNGLPHGVGEVSDKSGRKHTAKWTEGIDNQMI